MRNIEPSNAFLVGVGGPAGADDWEAAASAPAEKWTGRAGVFYEEGRQRTVQGGARVVVVWRSLTVAEDLGIDWQVGDTVTFRPEDLEDPLAGTVKAVEDPHSEPGAAGEVRLTLELT